MPKIIIQQINSNRPMTASYNLRYRNKDISSPSKKQLFEIEDDAYKISPKTDSKQTINMNAYQKSISKNHSFLSSGTGSLTDLTTNVATLHDTLIVEQYSNSMIDSGPHLQKIKSSSPIISKREDQGQSMVLEESALFIQINSQKQLIKNQNEYQLSKQRKSYKSINHSTPLGIPYRKCQSQMQEKIVAMLNKMKTKEDKSYGKQLDKLFTKIANAPSKDFRNKYFVSGVNAITKIITSPEYQKAFEPAIIQKIKQVNQIIITKILDQLDNIQDFLAPISEQKHQLDEAKAISRIFKILRRKYRLKQRAHLQSQAIEFVNLYKKGSYKTFKSLFQGVVST